MFANPRFYKPPREPRMPVEVHIECEHEIPCPIVIVKWENAVTGSYLFVEMNPNDARELAFNLYRAAENCETTEHSWRNK